LLNRLSWNTYTFRDSGKQPAIPVMTMSSPVGSWTSVETGMACSYGRIYCKELFESAIKKQSECRIQKEKLLTVNFNFN
jgi:hypothetical protein